MRRLQRPRPRATTYHCSFCGRDNHAVRRMIAGPKDVFICNVCIGLCNQILAEEDADENAAPRQRRPGAPS